MRALELIHSLALTLLAGTILPAAQDGPQGTSSDAFGGRLQGSVRTRDGKPYTADVTLFTTQVTSDQYLRVRYGPLPVERDGTFEMLHLPPGEAWIVVTKHDDPSRRWARTAPGSQFAERITIAAGGTTTVALVNRLVVLQGRVTRSGRPGAGLKLSAWPPGQRGLPMDVGREIGGMDPRENAPTTGPDGSYSLTVSHPGQATLNLWSADDAAHFELRAVAVPDVDTHALDLSVGGTEVTGVVTDETTGEPVARTNVSVRGTYSRADDSGRFVLELPNGEHTVRASSRDRAYDETSPRTITVGESALPEIRLSLRRMPSIKGRALDENGRPVQGARISACGPRPARPGDGMVATSAADGSFEVLRLETGPYTVVGHGPEGRIGLRANVVPNSSEIALTVGAPSVVTLRVTDASGQAASGALAHVQTIDGGVPCSVGSAAADSQGIAAMRLPPAGGKADVIVRRGPVERRLTVDAAPGRARERKVRLPRPPPAPDP